MADNFGLKIGIEGEKEFKKALSEINQSFKVLGSEMKLVSSQFDKNDKSIQALSARNTVLNKEIDAQRQKIETLRAALRNAADSFGENDRRTQNWQIQLNNAEAALNGMERELSDNERAIEALSQEETDAADATERLSREIAQQEDALAGMKRAYSNAVLQYGKGSSEAKELEGHISQLSGELRENRERMKDAGDVAEDLGDSLEDASEGADKLGSGLSVATVAMGNLISSGIQAALNGIKELGSAIWNLDEATEEYRVAQGKLTTAFEAAGYSGEAAQKSYNEFYKILGDTDTATEASQLLAQLAQNEQDITKWTNIAAGVYGTFGDALPIEGMIESANETAKVGEVTGSLADALNWVGISEDAFNEKLAACSSESERNRLIMETLSGAYAMSDHHEAIISREVFEAANALIAQRGKEKGIIKGSEKYQSRYCFSGRIVCGECGDTFKRRIHSTTTHKYAAWCCNTHIEDKSRCSIKYIRDDTVKAAFVTMINKLIFAHSIVLKPYVETLQNGCTNAPMRRIQQIQTLLLENAEQRETLTKLMAQGYIDQILYNEENNTLLSQADRYRQEMDTLSKAIGGDGAHVTAAKELLRYVEKAAMLTDFDEALFENTVTCIKVLSREEIAFELKCGLTLKERM